MIRKSLFWGLTLVLVVALVSLIIRGRQIEKQQQSAKSDEVVQQSKSSPIRVTHPEDLKIVSATMQFDSRHAAVHDIEFRNTGSVPYSAIELSFVYLDRSGKVQFTQTRVIGDVSVPPSQGYTATNVTIDKVPVSATRFQVSILSADMPPQGPVN